MRMNADKGFIGMAGSIDCQHYEWNNCPTQLAGQYKGEENKRTILLEGITDGELWLWFVFYRLPGSMNYLNILDKLTTKGSILDGNFPPCTNYSMNEKDPDLLYILADGIYPSYAIFVKTISHGGNNRRCKNFSKGQEAVRKDFERAFGVPIHRWHIC